MRPVASVEQQIHRVALDHLPQAAVVIARGMCRDDDAQPAHARRAQPAHDPGLRRAAVEEDRSAVGVLDQRRVALADVEERDGQAPRRRRRSQEDLEPEDERRGCRKAQRQAACAPASCRHAAAVAAVRVSSRRATRLPQITAAPISA